MYLTKQLTYYSQWKLHIEHVLIVNGLFSRFSSLESDFSSMAQRAFRKIENRILLLLAVITQNKLDYTHIFYHNSQNK